MITPINKTKEKKPLSRWKFTVNGRTKFLFALNKKHAEMKAKKNKWI